jgi:hypothetical protein
MNESSLGAADATASEARARLVRIAMMADRLRREEQARLAG